MCDVVLKINVCCPLRDLDYVIAKLLIKIDVGFVLRDLVGKDLITKASQLTQELKDKEINLKKTRKVYLEDSQYYIEDVRKKIIEKLIKLILQSEGLKFTASFKKLTNKEAE